MGETTWAEEIRENLNSARRALEAFRKIEMWASRNVPEALESHLAALSRELNEVSSNAEQAVERYWAEPMEKVLAGFPLSREQYHICRAMGMNIGTAREVGLSGWDDYEVYRMLLYEDDKQYVYINIHEKPREAVRLEDGSIVSKAHLRFGQSPEECRRRFLRPEQQTFFVEYLPDVYARFSEE